MTTAFVLGNGISRLEIPLAVMQQQGKIYGCNALYRDFIPDVLISTDRAIATHIQESGYAKTNRFYTRRPLPDMGACAVPSDYFGYSSGPIAASIAALDKHTLVYLVGFDLGPTTDNQFNNIYAGTQFYKPSGSNPTFTGNWIKQIKRVLTDHARVRFVRLCGPTTACIPELENIPNLKHQDISSFLTQ
jgi:hypothetical protein